MLGDVTMFFKNNGTETEDNIRKMLLSEFYFIIIVYLTVFITVPVGIVK